MVHFFPHFFPIDLLTIQIRTWNILNGNIYRWFSLEIRNQRVNGKAPFDIGAFHALCILLWTHFSFYLKKKRIITRREKKKQWRYKWLSFTVPSFRMLDDAMMWEMIGKMFIFTCILRMGQCIIEFTAWFHSKFEWCVKELSALGQAFAFGSMFGRSINLKKKNRISRFTIHHTM